MSSTILVTEELLESGKSKRGGWTRAQTMLLGESWPLIRGWKKRVVGREIPRVDADRFVSLGTDAVMFAELALGARFRYSGDPLTRVYVKLSRGGTVALWEDSNAATPVLDFKEEGEADPKIELVTKPDPDFTDDRLLRVAVGHLGVFARRRQPRWAVAMHLFGTGSTSACKLCLRFGFDPNSEIGPSEWELVERAVCSEDEDLTVERWEEIFPGVEPPPVHERR